ncbi:MAG: YfbK domain-containing protein [Chitinophagaceae bacterium]
MKRWIILMLLVAFFEGNAQFYYRGILKNELGKPIPGAKIKLFSNGERPYYSDDDGLFGITSTKSVDSITIIAAGYQDFKQTLAAGKYHQLVLQMLPKEKEKHKKRLNSVIKFLTKSPQFYQQSTLGESYATLLENELINAQLYPQASISLSINRAAYSNIRRFINLGMRVPVDAVRIEEMLNYFTLGNLPANEKGETFNFKSTVTTCPWNKDNLLASIHLRAPKLLLDTLPPSNLVFLIDVSGSMDKENRLPLVQAAFKLLTENLRPQDKVAIVTYGGMVSVALPTTSGENKTAIIKAIDSLSANGDTPGAGAIHSAYTLARTSFIPGGNNRVILATDGDFNVGQTSEKDLENLIMAQRYTGIYLTCLGVGMGNYKDSKLETLAKKGEGNFAYIDNIQEAEKVLVTEFTKTMYTVANDTYIDFNFNKNKIKQYRIIGFDNKKDAVTDSLSELEGGEVGSGHYITLLIEITPTSNAFNFQNEHWGTATLHFIPSLSHNAQAKTQTFTIQPATIAFEEASTCIRFSTAVAMFGTLLKQGKAAKLIDIDDVQKIAFNAADTADIKQVEFLKLVEKAAKIYAFPKIKKP